MSDELNRLPPPLRPKNRYLKFKIHSQEDFDLGKVVDAVWKSSLKYLGTKETSEADFWVIGNRFSQEKQEGIIKLNREKLDEFRASLALINQIDGEKAFLEIEKISGSIKKLKDN